MGRTGNGSSRRNRGSMMGNLVLLTATVVIAFGAAEIVVRTLLEMENLGTVVRFDPVLGWSLDPNTGKRSVDHSRDLDYRIRINSEGMREREFERSKPEGRRRILHIGDSIAFGLGVGDSWRFSDFMGRALKGDVEVLNAGVPGWGTDQEVLHFENTVGDLRPDIVILTFTMVNDIVNNAINHQFLDTTSKPRFQIQNEQLVLTDPVVRPQLSLRLRVRNVLRKSQFLVLVKRRIQATRTRRAVVAGTAFPLGFGSDHNRLTHWSVFRESASPEIEAAWKVTGALLGRLAQLCRDNGAELIVFSFPLMEADDEWLSWLLEQSGVDRTQLDFERPFERLAQICRDNGAQFVYPLEEFRDAGRQRDLYLEKDGHPNEFGHALAARVLLKHLEDRHRMKFEISSTDAVFVGNTTDSNN